MTMNDLALLLFCTTLLFLYTTWKYWTRAEAYRDLWLESMHCWDKSFQRGEEKLAMVKEERDRAHARLQKIDRDYPNSL